MEAITFSILPAEIHVSIAEHCKNHDLINLCLTSKLVNERCLPLLYRHVDLLFNRQCSGVLNSQEHPLILDAQLKRQLQFIHALLSHPEYGKHVRLFKGRLCVPSPDVCDRLREPKVSVEELWRAMRSLSHVQSVDVASKIIFTSRVTEPAKQFSCDLFQSATSVRLVGQMQYGLAKSILNAVNPATLAHLCLDFVLDKIGGPQGKFVSGENGEDGRIIALGVISGLLTTLICRCTALRTLVLRRIGQTRFDPSFNAAAEEASYIEWASFIRSVQGTVEKITFEQAADVPYFSGRRGSFDTYQIMDERFRRLVLPAIISGNWPCLIRIELRGVQSSNGRGELKKELRAVFNRNVRIVVKEEPRTVYEFREPNHWN